MTAIPAPGGYAWPAPTDAVVIGFADSSFDRIQVLRRSAITGVVAIYGGMLLPDANGEDVWTSVYGAAVEAGPAQTIVVGLWDNPAERRSYMLGQASAWVMPA